jgi:hypothetical protein
MPSSSIHFDCLEKKLLVVCARAHLTPAITAEIRALLAEPLDWDYLFAEASENSIVPLFARNLQAVGLDLLPATQLPRLKAVSRRNTVRCLYLVAELNRLLDLFEARGVVAFPFKGPSLAAQAYGDMVLRDFDDLDLLMPQRDFALAHEILLKSGYLPRYPWILSPGARNSLVPGEYHYRDEGRRILVELHTDFTLRHFPETPDIEALAEPPAFVSLAGRSVRTFSPEVNLALLAIHGAKDFWERLSWIADISELIQSQPTFDWAAARLCAASLGATRMVNLALTLAHALLDAPLPPDILALINQDTGAAWLARQVYPRLLGREIPPWSGVDRFRFRARAISSGIGGFRYSLRLSTAPAEEDWEMIRLPRSLAPLYLVLRPFRLFRKYGFARPRSVRVSSE